MLDIREYDRKVHKNMLYYTTEDEEDQDEMKKPLKKNCKIPTKHKENTQNFKQSGNISKEILIKNENFSKK